MGNAGRIYFPDHMKTIHQEWLNNTGSDAIESSIVSKMNVAIGSTPFGSADVYDPSSRLTAMGTAVGDFNTLIDALDWDGDWEAAVTAAVTKADAEVFDSTTQDADIAAFQTLIDTRIEDTVLPRFQAGLRDVNAVMSSAFVIGESLIEAQASNEVVKYGTDLKLKERIQRNDFILKSVETLLRDHLARIELEGKYVHYFLEYERMAIVATKEKYDFALNVEVQAAKWDLEIYAYGCNMLSAIGGGTFMPNIQSPSTAQSALGGALSGAAIGSQVGGGWGAAIGGAIGGIGGYFS